MMPSVTHHVPIYRMLLGKRLSWGGGVGFTSIGIEKLLFSGKVINFPNLVHLELNMKQETSFPFEHASNIPSLQYNSNQ